MLPVRAILFVSVEPGFAALGISEMVLNAPSSKFGSCFSRVGVLLPLGRRKLSLLDRFYMYRRRTLLRAFSGYSTHGGRFYEFSLHAVDVFTPVEGILP